MLLISAVYVRKCTGSASVGQQYTTVSTKAHCDPPPVIMFTTTTQATASLDKFPINSTVEYHCFYGYYRHRGDKTRTCTKEGSTNVPFWNGISLICKELRHYVGCFRIQNMNAVMKVFSKSSVWMGECRQQCKLIGKHFSGYIPDSSCFCLDNTTEGVMKVNDAECNVYRNNGFSATTTSSSDVIRVMWTFYNYYSSQRWANSSGFLPSATHFSYIDMTHKICLAYCRGHHMRYAIVQKTDCYCSKQMDVNATVTSMGQCTNASDTCPGYTPFSNSPPYGKCGSNQCYRVLVAEPFSKMDAWRRTCLDIYNLGNFVHARYWLNFTDKGSDEYCYMKDGTVCDKDWVGYDGSCYLFNTTIITNMAEGINSCAQHNAFLVSITTSEEQDFIRDAILKRRSLGVPTSFLIGLYDHHNVSRFTWVDGNLLHYGSFSESVQLDPSNNCVVMHKDYDYTWIDANCSGLNAAVICKKSKAYHGCFETDSQTDPEKFIAEDMTIAYCIEICRHRDYAFAALQKKACICYSQSQIISHNISSMGYCNDACPWNRRQKCGGTNHTSIYRIDEFDKPVSCEDLIFNDIPVSTNRSSSPAPLLNFTCTIHERQCKPSWIPWEGNCYKFHIAYKWVKEAVDFCKSLNSTLATVISRYKHDALYDISQSIPFLSDYYGWRLGMVDSVGYGESWSSSDGSLLDTDAIHKASNPAKRCTRLSNEFEKHATRCYSRRPLLCESPTGQLGCHDAPPGNPVYDNYTQNSATLCIETCRVTKSIYAAATKLGCFCINYTTPHVTGNCNAGCLGKLYQGCGNDSYHAVFYKMDMYQLTASSCQQLYEQGVRRNGDYVISLSPHNSSTSASVVTCIMKDGTVKNCPDNYVSWRHSCYKFSRESVTWNQANELCRADGGELASLTTPSEIQFVRNTLYGLASVEMEDSWHIGAVDADIEENGIFTWLDGNLLQNWPTDWELWFKTGQQMKEEHHYICEKKTYKVSKCVDASIQFGDSFGPYYRMTNTLCQQLCLANNYTVYGTRGQHCYCLPAKEFSNMTNTASNCSFSCPGNVHQMCGGPSTMTVNHMDDELQLAESCTVLYENSIYLQFRYLTISNDVKASQVCGISDYTACENSRWFGFNGHCYSFSDNKHFTNVLSAKETCLSKNGLLTSVNDLSEKSFLSDLIEHVLWLREPNEKQNIGFVDPSRHLISSDGSLHEDGDLEDFYGSILSEVQYHKKLMLRPVRPICEKHAGYVGCFNISGESTISNEDMTATACIEFCRGLDYIYAAVSGRRCHCEHNLTNWVNLEKYSDCLDTCESAPHQPCGNETMNYGSVFALDYYKKLASSCGQLWDQLVRIEGYYYIRDASGQTKKIKCFQATRATTTSTAKMTTSTTTTTVPPLDDVTYEPCPEKVDPITFSELPSQNWTANVTLDSTNQIMTIRCIEDNNTLYFAKLRIVYGCSKTSPVDGFVWWDMFCYRRPRRRRPPRVYGPVIARPQRAPEEAPGAVVIGTSELIIVASVLGFIVFLDLATFGRQFKMMRKNLGFSRATARKKAKSVSMTQPVTQSNTMVSGSVVVFDADGVIHLQHDIIPPTFDSLRDENTNPVSHKIAWDTQC